MKDTECVCGGFAETEREFGDFCVSGFPFQDPVQILLFFRLFFCKAENDI